MENRNFQLEGQWSAVYYPEKPTGFGVIIFGDERHYVDERTSFWSQNAGKRQIVTDLKEAGYTLFTSNFYGKNWGAENAVRLASTLYEFVMKNEILNRRIHILAEGMGTLAALAFAKEMNSQIRSIVLLNPILSIKHHLEQEKENKFFYRKITREIAHAYEIKMETAEKEIACLKEPVLDLSIPIMVVHILSGGRSYSHARTSKNILSSSRTKPSISEMYVMPEKAGQLGGDIVRFMSRYEKNL
ncbi:hydrolase [Neobacillus notoginsengisoli]|uniref:Hydrolase n=1 Tax=Neobacillus notoginsengisoli TaxID=1578198 RepID=A0A417YZM5_9BACI|nr:hydrolase [Neobacillus notoginsengisoli]RHW43204.1 hydrolase [Neobacillus notoginsengisoli]